jgi:tRNA (guanine37-N1)-methyltransferase
MRRLHGIVLPMQEAEKALGVLRKMELFLGGYEFQRANGNVTIPIVREPSPREENTLRTHLSVFQVEELFFEPVVSRPRKLKDAVSDKIPSNLIPLLPHSLDVIGDIAVLELSSELESYAYEIGNGILRVNPHVRLVVKKLGDVTGLYRTRSFQVLAGFGSTETVHREFSCSYRLDLASVYFNPRLSHERLRVARPVAENDVVVDMFAGVGPYSVLIAKSQPGARVYSIDINPAAISYLRENIFSNRVAGIVIPIVGDARELSETKVRGVADRVVMNLPSRAWEYLDAALQMLKREGGFIHFYQFVQREKSIDSIKDVFRSSIEAKQRKVESFKFCRAIREIAPGKVQVAIDAVIR